MTSFPNETWRLLLSLSPFLLTEGTCEPEYGTAVRLACSRTHLYVLEHDSIIALDDHSAAGIGAKMDFVISALAQTLIHLEVDASSLTHVYTYTRLPIAVATLTRFYERIDWKRRLNAAQSAQSLITLTKNRMVREVGRRTRLKNRDVQAMVEALVEVWTEELVNGGRIELEGFMVLETEVVAQPNTSTLKNFRATLRLRYRRV